MQFDGPRLREGRFFWTMDERKAKTTAICLAVAGLLFFLIAAIWLRNRTEPKNSNPSIQQTNAAGQEPIQMEAAIRVTVEEALTAALAELFNEADAMRREEMLEHWLSQVDGADIPELVALLDNRPFSKLTGEIKLRLFHKMASQNPAAAARLAMQQAAGTERQTLLNAIGGIWAGLNLADAISWAQELPAEDRNGVFLMIANEAIATDPRQALELARELPASEALNEMVAQIASEWAAKNPAEIAEWAEKIADAGLRQQVVRHVAIAWAETNPSKAAELAIGKLSPGKDQNDAIVSIVQRWVQNSPAEAADWVSRFPESEVREDAARELINLWADRNISDAGKWVNTLPAGKSKDTALGAYVGKIASSHPQTAAEWVVGIVDVGLRNRQMERVAETWLEQDKAAARHWIESSPLPDDVKQNLLSAAK